MTAWVLPDHIADVLPAEARHIEDLRRRMLDTANAYGYELVIPPLIEHLESLLTGTGEALDLQTFKLVDQLSGRMLGVRADTTPQVARIDAHLLNRAGVTRLCYCGPVLRTRPDRPHASREPLQFGAELYGHAGLEADLEVVSLALDGLTQARVGSLTVDLGDARILRSILAGSVLDPIEQTALNAALAAKDGQEVAGLARGLGVEVQQALRALVDLYGDASVLDEAQRCLAGFPGVAAALDALRWMAQHVDGATVTFDLADASGYAYYSGVRFTVYAEPAGEALARGGRYDGVGAVFARRATAAVRPAVGFSLDLKAVVAAAQQRGPKPAIRAPWGQGEHLRAAIASLRGRGETVVCMLPGHESEIDEFFCDRELVEVAGHWIVRAI
ncbi:ATP phosphoribosyltransferase regulatory subunit [Tibeticola sp.]|jgi:ATP phosphoribosyltransferase regulatory subunit|uniref:ATP phosphoribosyltransferase regulatory subunit n=1 Tax=Tibeticola sp. TaxID=2005368 RepID=UPI00258A1389|nr:ATP phosphoribosyltransferase regulatory subunit [Tibeticola sp.]MCI4440978.1 ATP phosphoribosyltransferase regulatory subunit [Tibeticola sp.]